jgi:Uri superfamily endonuclease
VLVLDVAECRITVGRLGCVVFPAGLYAYVGSALGIGGLAARVARHRRGEKRRHWHIDYLLDHARIVDVYVDATGRRLECRWSQALLSYAGATEGPRGFGASDCQCRTHLFYLGPRSVADLALVASLLSTAS